MSSTATLEVHKRETIIKFPKYYQLNKATQRALYTAGFSPYQSTYNKHWHSTSVEEEQAQRLVNTINSGAYEKEKEMLYAKKKQHESVVRR